jgi:hypothetical protein
MWYSDATNVASYAKFSAGNQSAWLDVFDETGASVTTIEHDAAAHHDNAKTHAGV